MQNSAGILARVSPLELTLVSTIALAALSAFGAARRGGQFRGLPGWGGLWIVLGVILIALSRLHRLVGFTLLGGLMFVALRAYFFGAPVRPRDRYAILASYVTIPFALWLVFTANTDAFLATVPVTLFLLVPVFLAVGPWEQGLIDAMGRTVLGVLFFVFCIAHVGLLVHLGQGRLPELFGLLVLLAELPQRLAGRFRADQGWVRPALGVACGIALALVLGFKLGPWCGLVEEDGARAGLLVGIAVTLGAQVGAGIALDLAPDSATARLGRGSLVGRLLPTVYAAPVFFHYLNHFA